jgi:hypothetical protein
MKRVFGKEVKEMKMEEITSRLKEIVMDRLDVEEDQIKPEASLWRISEPIS